VVTIPSPFSNQEDTFAKRHRSMAAIEELPTQYSAEVEKGVRRYLASNRPIHLSRAK
jgi:hypothetical protein